MKKQHLLRYLLCALLYLLILWIATDKKSADEAPVEEAASVLDSGIEEPESIVAN